MNAFLRTALRAAACLAACAPSLPAQEPAPDGPGTGEPSTGEKVVQEVDPTRRSRRPDRHALYPLAEDGTFQQPDVPFLEVSLEQVLDMALQQNLGLAIEEQATEVARFNARGSWGAFDWVLDANGSVTEAEFQGQSQLAGADVLELNTQAGGVDLTKPLRTGGTFSVGYRRENTETNNQFSLVNPSTSDNLNVNFTQPLLRGAWESYATSSQVIADLDYERQRERFRQVRQELLRDVANAYWDLVSARDQLLVQRSSMELAREQVDQNERRLEAGVGTEVEVVQAQSDLAQRIEDVLLAQVNVADAMDNLKRLLFDSGERELWSAAIEPTTSLPADISQAAAPPWETAVDQALQFRSELQQQRILIRAAEQRHLQAKSERRIGLDLNLNASGAGFSGDPDIAFEDSFSFDFPTYTAGLNLNVPLGNTTARNSEKAARAQLRSERLVFDQLQISVLSDVRAAVRQVVYQAEAVVAAERSVEFAVRQLDAEQARFQEGLSTNFQVLEFQQTLTEARSSEAAARAGYAKALVGLEFSLGVLGD